MLQSFQHIKETHYELLWKQIEFIVFSISPPSNNKNKNLKVPLY